MTTIERATRILTAIQDARNPTLRKLAGDDVTVEAIPENAFRVVGPAADDPTALASYEVLRRVGAEIKIVPMSATSSRYVAVATWDTALHGLVGPGILTRTT